MNDLQLEIKNCIEAQVQKDYGVKVVVEYVSDIEVRKKQILETMSEKMNQTYDADHYTGVFIPQAEDNPYYILIQENRNNNLDIMTAFHEYQHLRDYIIFLNVVFHNNVDALKDSQLYISFNLYSEFMATREGMYQYIKYKYSEVYMTKDKYIEQLEVFLKEYKKFQGVKTRYQLLMHNLVFLGRIIAIQLIDAEIDVSYYTHELFSLKENAGFEQVVACLVSYDNSAEWYIEFDKVVREFIK